MRVRREERISTKSITEAKYLSVIPENNSVRRAGTDKHYQIRDGFLASRVRRVSLSTPLMYSSQAKSFSSHAFLMAFSALGHPAPLGHLWSSTTSFVISSQPDPFHFLKHGGMSSNPK